MDSASGSSCQMTRLIGRDRVEVLYRLPRDQWMTTALVAPAVSDASQADLKSSYQLTAVWCLSLFLQVTTFSLRQVPAAAVSQMTRRVSPVPVAPCSAVDLLVSNGGITCTVLTKADSPYSSPARQLTVRMSLSYHTIIGVYSWRKLIFYQCNSRDSVVYVWYMCGICVVYVRYVCGRCVVYVWYTCCICVIYFSLPRCSI